MNPNHDNLNISIKIFLHNLTMIVEMLISPVITIMSVYRLSGGQFVSIGWLINFKQDISSITIDITPINEFVSDGLYSLN